MPVKTARRKTRIFSRQWQTNVLSKSCCKHLKGFYEKKAAALLQQEACWPSSPPGFKDYKTNVASGGVMGMIRQIINDTKAMEVEASLFNHRSSTSFAKT